MNRRVTTLRLRWFTPAAVIGARIAKDENGIIIAIGTIAITANVTVGADNLTAPASARAARRSRLTDLGTPMRILG